MAKVGIFCLLRKSSRDYWRKKCSDGAAAHNNPEGDGGAAHNNPEGEGGALHTRTLRVTGALHARTRRVTGALHTMMLREKGVDVTACCPLYLGVLLEVGGEGVSPDEVALAHEVEAVVGEVGAEAALVVGKEGVEVDPGDAVAAGDLLEELVGLYNDVIAALEQLPLAHVVVEGEQALEVDLGAWRALLDDEDEALHGAGDAVGADVVGDVVDSAHDEEFAGLSLDDGVDAIDEALDDVADDAAVLDVAVAQELVELAAVGEAVAEHDDVLLADGELGEEGRTACVIGVLVGLGGGREAQDCHHGQDSYLIHCYWLIMVQRIMPHIHVTGHGQRRWRP